MLSFINHHFIWQAEQGKDKGGKKGADKKDRTKSAKGAAKGGKKTPEPAAAKDGSKLKKRGEEDLDNKYIGELHKRIFQLFKLYLLFFFYISERNVFSSVH